MAIDFSVYNPPGVYTNPIPGPQIAVTSTLPTAVGLFGMTIGYQNYIQTVLINPDSASAIPTVAVQTTTSGAAGINDVQTVTLTGANAGTTFTLTFGGQTTATIATNATASAVQSALQALSSVGSGNATVSGSAGGPYTVTFTGALGGAPQTLMTAAGQGVNAQQSVTIGGSPTGGTFTLTFGGQTTSAIAYNASASTVQTALQALSTIGAGNATVTGAAGGPWTVTFTGTLGNAAQTLMTASGASLTPSGSVTVANVTTGSTPPTVTPVHTTTGVLPINAVQSITVTGTAGTFTLTYGGQTSSPIAYNASAATVQTALQAVSTVGANNAVVTGSPGGPFTVTFQNTLGGQSIANLVATGAPTLTPTLTQTLAQAGINQSTVKVTNPNTGAPYVVGTDYTVQLVSGTVNTPNALYAIQRVLTGHITPGQYIQVQYQFTNGNYFAPTKFFTYQDVVTAYGAPYNQSTGAIQSELTLAAQFAFLNGASFVICAAVQPTGSNNTPTIGDYGNALNELADEPEIAFVVPATGQQPLFQLVQEHVDQQSSTNFERRAIVGLDGTSTAVPSSQRIIDAQQLSDARVMLVSPATFTYFSPELNQSVTLGGQFMAASLAGICIKNSFAMPLTRKVLTGWTDVTEKQRDGQKNLESQNGLCVIEKTRQQLIWVRHGLATKNTDLTTREWSITGQQDAMSYRLRDYLNAASLIGQPIYPYTLVNVKASVEAGLQSLLRDGLIVDYTGLSVRQLLTNPDVIEVTYQWKPAFPLNYIVVTFSISLSSGNVTANAGATSQSNVTNSNSTSTTSTISVPTSSSTNDFGGPSNTLLQV